MYQWFGLSRSGLRFIILLWLRFTTEPMSTHFTKTCSPSSTWPRWPKQQNRRQSTAAKSGWKSAPRSLGCGARQRGLGLTVDSTALVEWTGDSHCHVGPRCVPNPERSSWILFWLSWYKIAFRFDVTATVFYFYIVKIMIIVVYWNCYHTMLLGWFSMFCNAIQLF